MPNKSTRSAEFYQTTNSGVFMYWDYAAWEYVLSAALLVCAMFGMGATLNARDFLGVLKSPQGLCLIVTMQIVVMPLVAIVLARFFELPAGIAIGMVLVSALPGGLFSNVLTFLGRGNVALSVSATAVSTVGCLFTTVTVLKIFAATELPDDFSMPAGRILAEVGLCLLLPLLLGMILHRAAPRLAPKATSFCVRASWVLLVIIVSAALLAGRLDLTAYGWKSPLVIVLFGMIALWLSYAAAFLSAYPSMTRSRWRWKSSFAIRTWEFCSKPHCSHPATRSIWKLRMVFYIPFCCTQRFA